MLAITSIAPLCTDVATNKPNFDRSFGHFMRVFVDMDLTNDMRYKVLVEWKGFALFVEIDYENLLDYFTFCKCTAHYYEICKMKTQPEPKQKAKEDKSRNKPMQDPKKTLVKVVDSNKVV